MTTETVHPLLTKKTVASLVGVATTLLSVVVANMNASSGVRETVMTLTESVQAQRLEIGSLAASDSAIRRDLAYLKEKAMKDSIRTVLQEEFEKRYRINIARLTPRKEVTYARYEE